MGMCFYKLDLFKIFFTNNHGMGPLSQFLQLNIHTICIVPPLTLLGPISLYVITKLSRCLKHTQGCHSCIKACGGKIVSSQKRIVQTGWGHDGEEKNEELMKHRYQSSTAHTGDADAQSSIKATVKWGCTRAQFSSVSRMSQHVYHLSLSVLCSGDSQEMR